jgi:RHS repeat-associated protein
MRPTRIVIFFTLLSILCLYPTPPVAAQDDANFEIGLKPFGSYQGGNIDQVSLGNGGLSVDIPLISYPQRGGKLKLEFALHYSNQSYSEQEICGQGCFWVPVFNGGGMTVVETQSLANTFVPTSGGTTPNIITATEHDGAAHRLYATGSNLLEATDASGYKGVGGSGVSYYEPVVSITDREGITHTTSSLSEGTPGTSLAPNCFFGFAGYSVPNGQYTGITGQSVVSNTLPRICLDSRSDANGNGITFSSTVGWTDTIGRNIPLPTESTNQNDFSGCTGTQPISFVFLWSPPGVNAGTYPLKFCYFDDGTSSSFQYELQSVVLPNGMAWTFAYTPAESTVPNLSQITFPTGGTLSYTWTLYTPCPPGTSSVQEYNNAVASRTLAPNDGITASSVWTYSYSASSLAPAQTIVSAPPTSGPTPDDTVHSFALGSCASYGSCGCALYETQTQYYQGSHTSGTLLETVNKTYSYLNLGANVFTTSNQPLNLVPASVTTIWANGQTSKVTSTYDSGFNFYSILGVSGTPPYNTSGAGSSYTGTYRLELTQQEYDYGNGAPGSLLRTTTNTYLALNSSSYRSANLLQLFSSVQIKDGGGTQRAYTTYAYDESGSPAGTHGNLTSTHRWLNTTGTYLISSNVYNSNGLVTSSTDPKGNPTTYGYAPSSCPANSGYAGSGATSVANALSQTTSNCYDLATGLLVSTTDPNSKTTSYQYDGMLRTTQINNPDGGQATFSYPNPNQVNISETINSSTNRLSYLLVDGVGRQIRQAVTNGETKPYDEADTCYDGLGRASFKSYPFQDSGPFATTRSCGSPELGDTSTYDALSRTKNVTHSDGSYISTAYSGNSTTVTDEQSKTRQSAADGLGRMTQVIEDIGTNHFNYTTNYTYDVLGNLTGVTQAGSRQRTFVYDSLSRLTSSTNPESNWSPGSLTFVATTFAYDADGNLINKTEPTPNQQSTLTTTLTYCYDPLNRMTAKGYAAQTCTNGWLPTPIATYVYDGGSLPSGCSVGSFSYGSIIGKRSAMCDAAGSEAWGYNIVSGTGWQITDQRTTNSLTKTAIYQNNFLGSPASVQYPSGRTIGYQYNAAGRSTYALDGTTSVYYANAVHYGADGAQCWATFGGAATAAATFNGRLQPQEMQAKSAVVTYPGTGCPGLGQTGNLLDLTYSFNYGSGDNGNVMGITNNIDGTRSQTFAYDALNRIITGETTSTYATSPAHCWGEAYLFDNQTTAGGAWGNLTAIGVASTAYNGCTQESLSVTATAQNQITNGSSIGYDSAGNMKTNSASTYTYDAENHLTSTAGVNYIYDGDGGRVEKSNGKIYWYGMDGNVLDETDLTGSTTNSSFSEYVYLGQSRIARHDSSNNVLYYFSDHLGTSRVNAQVLSGSTTASLCYDADFYPFGGERPPYTNTCSQNYKFTGKERDTESCAVGTCLDNFGARFDASSMGRFLSPDPGNAGAHPEAPQSWNAYPYVDDRPLSETDPTGLDCVYFTGEITVVRGDCLSDKDNGYYVDGTIDVSKPIVFDPNNHTFEVQLTDGQGEINPFHPRGAPREIGLQHDAIFDTALMTVLGGVPALLRSGGVGLLWLSGELGADGAEEALSNQAAGKIIGWGTDQAKAGVDKTVELAENLTKDQVKAMADKGLTLEKAQQLAGQYAKKLAEEGAKEANKQLLPRYQLMQKIIQLWPGK